MLQPKKLNSEDSKKVAKEGNCQRGNQLAFGSLASSR